MFDHDLNVLQARYRVRITRIQAGKGGGRGDTVDLPFDPRRRWRDMAVWFQRDWVCERCGQSVTDSFTLATRFYPRRGGGEADYDLLAHHVEQRLRRRIRCPHCGEVQQEPRRALQRRDRRHTAVGCVGIGGGVLGMAALVLAGGYVAGAWGAVIGALLALALDVLLTRWMLARLLD